MRKFLMIISIFLLFSWLAVAEEAGIAKTAEVCGRTEEVVDVILTKVGKLDCSEVTVEDLKTIVNLYLSYRGIKSLKANDFSGLTSLQILNLSFNELERISPDQFFRFDFFAVA